MIAALGIAQGGISEALAKLDRAATRVAAGDAAATAPQAVVDLVEARGAARANAAVLRRANETIGVLLDVLA